MASKQLQLKKQEQETKTLQGWKTCFEQDFMTFQGSKIFVKQLTALAFSCITYMRSIFPEYAYQEKTIDGVHVKILTGNYECKDAYLMTRWVKSAFHALDQKYMRELILEILTKDEEPLEYYAVTYKYTKDGPTCSLSTDSESKNSIDFDAEDVQNATKKLITTLLSVTETLNKLPDSYQLQMRINYYDDLTPSDYKPKFFKDAVPYDWDQLKVSKHCLGDVSTPFHTLTMAAGSTLVDLQEMEQNIFSQSQTLEAEKKDKNTESKLKKEFLKQMNLKKTEESPMSEAVVPGTPQTPPNKKLKLESPLQLNWTWTMDKSAENDDELERTLKTQNEFDGKHQANCICTLNFGKKKLFQCEHCKQWQHLVCYKISPTGKEPENRCCYMCAKSGLGHACTDPTLMKYKTRQVKHLTMYRNILIKCHGLKTIGIKTLENFGIPADICPNLIKKLLDENFIRPKKNSRILYNINKYHLISFLNNYFNE